MNRRSGIAAVAVAGLLLVACNDAAPPAASKPPAGAVIAAGTQASAGVPDWTVVRAERVTAPVRYRLTVVVGGAERTFDASLVCFEQAVPGQVLPETIPSPRGYDIECRLNN